MSRLLLLLVLWFITLPIYSQDKNQSLKINEELIELRIQQQQLNKKIDDQKALLEEKFAVKQENLNYQKEEIGWRINTWINILGILVAVMGVGLPIIGLIYGRKVYDDIKNQREKIEEEHRKSISWIEEKREELLQEQKNLLDWIREKKDETERNQKELTMQLYESIKEKHSQLEEITKERLDKIVNDAERSLGKTRENENKTTEILKGINTKVTSVSSPIKMENPHDREPSQQAKETELSKDATPFEREMAKALGFFYENKYEECIEQHLMVLEKYKSQLTLDLLSDFYFRLAYSYGELNDHDNAIKYYELGLSIDNSNIVVWNNLGNVYIEKNDFDSAINKYSHAILINPNHAPSWYNRGIAYRKKDNFDMAIEQYEMAIQLNPSYVPAYNNLGVIYNEKNDLGTAIKNYSKALNIDPYYDEALFNMGNAYFGKKEFQNAIRYYQRAIDVNDTKAIFWNNMGMAHNHSKEYEIAIIKLNEAKRIDPNYDQTWYNLGFAFTNTNAYEKAIESYSEAIRLNPNYIEAIGNLAELLIIKDQNPEELLLKLKNDTSTTKEHFTYNFLDAIWQIKNKTNSKTKQELFENFIDTLDNKPSNLTWSFFDLRKWISKETSSTGLDDESRKLIEELITMLEEWRDQDKNAESK